MAVQPFTERASHDCESDMDSWGMNLMRESAWLKNSATENLDGIWKTGADILVDTGQDLALLPLRGLGPWTYVAGVAANAAAEDMYKQTAAGKAPHEALLSGALTAGVEVVSGKIMDAKNPYKPASVKKVYFALKNGDKKVRKAVARGLNFEVGREGTDYLLHLVAEQMKKDPEAEFDINELQKAVVKNRTEKLSANNAEKFWEAVEVAWNSVG